MVSTIFLYSDERLDPQNVHDPLDRLVVDQGTLAADHGCDPPVAVSTAVLMEDFADPGAETRMPIRQWHEPRLVVEATAGQPSSFEQIPQGILLP
jgi:hypothetical protein